MKLINSSENVIKFLSVKEGLMELIKTNEGLIKTFNAKKSKALRSYVRWKKNKMHFNVSNLRLFHGI